jgi:hypothetical protein
MPSIQLAHDYNPFALEDVGRLDPMAVELADCLGVRRFPSLSAAAIRSLRLKRHTA